MKKYQPFKAPYESNTDKGYVPVIMVNKTMVICVAEYAVHISEEQVMEFFGLTHIIPHSQEE